ncbi:MAG TPA: sigma-70 family RNA polymerase sigma factor [Rubricoccaceae bacterium]
MPTPPPRPSGSGPPVGEVTQLLHRLTDGDAGSADRMFPLVYAELRQIARARLRSERDGHTLTPTALVHEAFLRLVEGSEVSWQGRAHFYAVAAGVMRRLLVDWARGRRAEKRGGGAVHVSTDETGVAAVLGQTDREDAVLALDEALATLAKRSERQSRVVECRYFAGLTIEETAEALGVSSTTVRTDWRLARAWLGAVLEPDGDGP